MEQHHFDIVNHATPRLESMDKALGRGKYTDDLELPNMACAALVRCPYSHAKVLSIDVSVAEKVPGFLGCALPEEAPQAYFNCSGNPLWGDRIFEKCGIGRDERGDGGKTLEIRGKRRLSARDGGANYQQS